MDFLKGLFADLRSKDPSIRFSVLSRIEDLEWTEEQLASFKGLVAEETDSATRFHMLKILARVAQEKGQAKPLGAAHAEIASLLAAPQRDDLTLAMLLEALPRSEGPLTAMALREARWPEFSNQVLPFVLRFFRQFGSFEDVPAIESLCRHPDPRALAAAVETLEKLSPDSLKNLIVPLLVNPTHGIRSRAVRLLYRWDPQEALRHFEAMLFSEDLSDRNAALFHGFFFPFPEIEPLMLKFLGVESDPELLEKAGLLFRANPNPEEPLRLLEAREASGGQKRKLIGDILTGVVQSLHQAGLVKKTPDQMMRELADLFLRRKAGQMIERCQLALNSSSPQNRKDAALLLCDLLTKGYPDAKRILEQHLALETDTEVKNAVRQRVGDLAPTLPTPLAAPAVPEAAPAIPELRKLTAEQCQRVFAALTSTGLGSIRSQIPGWYKEVGSEQRQMLLRTLGRVGDKPEADFVEAALKDSDPQILRTAIEVLQDLDPERLSPFLPKLIQHGNDDVRAAAVRAFALFDKRQALSLIEKMLFAAHPRQRSLAIFSAGQFDFPSVRDILLQALQREGDPENLQQIAAICKANADEELYVQMIRIFRTGPGGRKDLVEVAAREVGATLVREKKTSHREVKALEEAVLRRLEAEQEKSRVAQPSYALKNIQRMRQAQAVEGGKIDPGLVRFALAAFGIGGVITALLWFLFLAPPAGGGKPVRSGQPISTRPPAFDRSPRDIQGTVIAVDPASKTVTVKVAGPPVVTFRIQYKSEPSRPFSKNSPFQGQVKPVSQGEGVILSDLVLLY